MQATGYMRQLSLTKFGFFLSFVLATFLFSAVAAQKNAKKNDLEPPSKVVQMKQAMSLKIGALAKWCLSQKLAEEGKTLVDEARVLDASNPQLKSLEPMLTEPQGGSDASRKAFDKKLSSLRKWLESQEKAIRATELKLATSEPVLCKAREHDMQYLLSLPGGWTKKKKWPLVVTVDGAGCNYMGNHRGFKKKGSLPAILITPITFSNTNQLDPSKYPYASELVDAHQSGDRIGFDEKGLLAVMSDLQEDCNADGKIYITGFSGGGNLTWRMVFGHPNKVAGAAPACANFSNPGEIDSAAEERKTLPVIAFQGDQDPYLDGNNDKGVSLNGEWEKVASVCKANGFENVQRKMLAGVKHSSCVTEVLNFFQELMKK